MKQATEFSVFSPRKENITYGIDDKHLTGKYMITAIKHIFYKDDNMSYNMQIEVSKDGLEEAIAIRESRKEI